LLLGRQTKEIVSLRLNQQQTIANIRINLWFSEGKFDMWWMAFLN